MALKINGLFEEALFEMAKHSYYSGEYDKGIEHIESCIRLNPQK